MPSMQEERHESLVSECTNYLKKVQVRGIGHPREGEGASFGNWFGDVERHGVSPFSDYFWKRMSVPPGQLTVIIRAAEHRQSLGAACRNTARGKRKVPHKDHRGSDAEWQHRCKTTPLPYPPRAPQNAPRPRALNPESLILAQSTVSWSVVPHFRPAP